MSDMVPLPAPVPSGSKEWMCLGGKVSAGGDGVCIVGITGDVRGARSLVLGSTGADGVIWWEGDVEDGTQSDTRAGQGCAGQGMSHGGMVKHSRQVGQWAGGRGAHWLY